MTASIPRLLAGLALCAAASFAHAQSYPTKPIRWVVPYGPGSTDILARILAEHAQAEFGQRLIIESRPGTGLLSRVSADKTKLAI